MATAAENIVFFDQDAANEAPTVPPGGAHGGAVLPFPEARSAIDPGVLGFPAGLLAQLPVPISLDVSFLAGARFAVVTDPDLADVRRARGERVLDGADWEVLVTATESDRLRGIDLAELLAARREGPLRLDTVLGGARPDPSQGWSVARVLSRLEVVIHAAGIATERYAELAA